MFNFYFFNNKVFFFQFSGIYSFYTNKNLPSFLKIKIRGRVFKWSFRENKLKLFLGLSTPNLFFLKNIFFRKQNKKDIFLFFKKIWYVKNLLFFFFKKRKLSKYNNNGIYTYPFLKKKKLGKISNYV